jgi:type VI secretion system protein ImpA
MSPIDTESLLAPVSEEAPCGEDLSYDPAYVELERTAQGTPEQRMGDSVVPAQEPNWREVREQCTDLLGRSKDLRLVLHLTLALLRLEGLAGLRDGLALLQGLLERFWGELHPRLDPEDDNDPTERMNIVASLSPSAGVYQDPMQFLRRVREAPLCASRSLGQFSLRDIMVATGEAPAEPDSPVPELSVIEAAFADTDVDELHAVAQAVEQAAGHIESIDALLTEQVGAGSAPDLGGILQVLGQVRKHVQNGLARHGVTQPAAAGPAPAAAEASAGAPAGGAAPARPGEIRSPQDVVLALDSICQYYERHEPSSPVPLLVARARRLVSKSFIDIVRDLTPEAMQKVELLGGTGGGSES